MPELLNLNKRQLNTVAPLLIGGVVLFLVPLFGGRYYTHIFILIFLHITLAMGFRLLYVTGLCPFCHISFYAIGAFTSALLTIRLGVPLAVAFLTAGVLAALIAAALVWVGGRLRGPYFFLLTFGFLGVTDAAFRHFRELTGGEGGLRGIPPIAGFTTITPYYYLILAFTIITILVMYRLDRSRFGVELMAIGDADDLAEIAGINVVRHRMVAYAIGSLFAGFAGSLFAHYEGFIAPSNFTMWASVYVIIWCAVGGAGKVWGPIAGAVLMTIVAEFLRMSGTMQAILYGVVLLIVLMAMPNGIVGLVDTLKMKRSATRYLAANAKASPQKLAE